jgi:MerR family transcriptional regulator, heat shock protein HspR
MSEFYTTDHEEPAFIISVAARMLGLHAQTLRYYERVGLIIPSRSRGRIRLYSRADLERIRQVQRLIDDLGVNLAGAEVIIDMGARIKALEEENESLRRELQRFRDRRLPAPLERRDPGADRQR